MFEETASPKRVEKSTKYSPHFGVASWTARAHLLPPSQKLGRMVRIHVEWQLCAGEGAVPYIMYSAKRIFITGCGRNIEKRGRRRETRDSEKVLGARCTVGILTRLLAGPAIYICYVPAMDHVSGFQPVDCLLYIH